MAWLSRKSDWSQGDYPARIKSSATHHIFRLQTACSVLLDRLAAVHCPLGWRSCPLSAQKGAKTDAENPQLNRLLRIDLEAAALSCFD
jgi:hypothetical protein